MDQTIRVKPKPLGKPDSPHTYRNTGSTTLEFDPRTEQMKHVVCQSLTAAIKQRKTWDVSLLLPSCWIYNVLSHKGSQQVVRAIFSSNVLHFVLLDIKHCWRIRMLLLFFCPNLIWSPYLNFVLIVWIGRLRYTKYIA